MKQRGNYNERGNWNINTVAAGALGLKSPNKIEHSNRKLAHDHDKNGEKRRLNNNVNVNVHENESRSMFENQLANDQGIESAIMNDIVDNMNTKGGPDDTNQNELETDL